MRVGQRGLGGNIVFLADRKRDIFLYYAHLDEHRTTSGTGVDSGDIIGTVGNTGNAQSTAPHLHIGVYDGTWRRPLDPWYFFVRGDTTPEPIVPHEYELGTWVRLSNEENPLVQHPPSRWGAKPSPARVDARGNPLGPEEKPLTALDAGPSLVEPSTRHLPLHVVGTQGRYLKIRTPFGNTGYVPATAVEALETPIRTVTLEQSTQARMAPAPASDVVATVTTGEEVEVYGSLDQYGLVMLPDGRFRWMLLPG
jgi:hypothetical protein